MTSTYEKNLSQMQQKMLLEQRRIKLRRLGRNRVAVIGTLIVLVMAVIAIAAPLIATHDPYAFVVADRLMPPSAQHLFGTDSMGQDVFSRVIYGTRTSMVVGLCVSLSAGFIGTLLGLYASANKVLDHILMRLCDGLKAIPSILFAICLMTMLGPDIKNVILSLAITSVPNMARIARSEALVVREQTYVEALRSTGASETRILWLHIAPNIISSIIVQMTFLFASSIIQEAALSFLGAGLPAGAPSWGRLPGGRRPQLGEHPERWQELHLQRLVAGRVPWDIHHFVGPWFQFVRRRPAGFLQSHKGLRVVLWMKM